MTDDTVSTNAVYSVNAQAVNFSLPEQVVC